METREDSFGKWSEKEIRSNRRPVLRGDSSEEPGKLVRREARVEKRLTEYPSRAEKTD